MTFDFNITTPANTNKNNPKVTTLNVTKGLLDSWRVNFPPGSQGLLHCNFTFGGKQIIPFESGNSLIGDNSDAGGREFLPILQQPLKIHIQTWNIDDTLEHLLFGQIYIIPVWTLSPFSEKFRQLLEEEENFVSELEGS